LLEGNGPGVQPKGPGWICEVKEVLDYHCDCRYGVSVGFVDKRSAILVMIPIGRGEYIQTCTMPAVLYVLAPWATTAGPYSFGFPS